MNWGDVPTWLLVVLAAVGGGAALWQLRLQRRQLQDQQDDMARRTRQLERVQADAIDLSWQPTAPLAAAPDQNSSQPVWTGVVQNDSRRPIRDVVCRVQPHPAQDFSGGSEIVAEIVSLEPGPDDPLLEFGRMWLGDRVQLVRSGAKFGFQTTIRAADHGVARMKVRFTDDAGLHWEIDPDLHLSKLDARDW